MHEKIGAVMPKFTASLKEVFSEDLLAVVLYGSAAGDSYREDVSDINVLVILEKGGADKLFKLGSTVKALIQKYRISPFFMTREEFTTAADVFPIEYCDILEANEVVYGDKKTLAITVSEENLRLQLEEKLRGAVGDVRGMLIAAGGNEKRLQTLLRGWAGLGGVLFRGLLRLKGKSVAGLAAETTIAEVEKEYGLSLEGFSALNRLRQSKKSEPLNAAAFAETLLKALAELVRKVDALDRKAK